MSIAVPLIAAVPFTLLGLQLLRIARSSGATPERLLAGFFLGLAAGIPPRLMSVDLAMSSGMSWTSFWLSTVASVFIGSALVCLAAFAWKVFRPGEAWAKRFVIAFGAALCAALLASTRSIIGVLWILVGYSLAFGEGNAFIGDLSMLGLSGINPKSVSGTIPTYVFVMFQGMFAIITPALMLGAFAERMKFTAYLAFIVIWVLVVYAPLAHMVWGGGFLGGDGLGAIDFAGGLVVHMSSGFSALAAAIVLGPRRNYGKDPMPPHNLPLTVIGASLLWVGWFGFNAGSQLAADGTAGLAFLNTNTATAMAVVTWVVVEWLHRGKPTVLGGATGAVAGLVAITPACASVSPLGAIGVGLGAGVLCYVAVSLLKPALGYDDSLDVFGVHGVGGMWGALATALFIMPVVDEVLLLSRVRRQLVELRHAFVLAVKQRPVSRRHRGHRWRAELTPNVVHRPDGVARIGERDATHHEFAAGR